MIKVHHLNFSRSTRILWALEELNVPYEIVRYERDANFRAPASLKNVHGNPDRLYHGETLPSG
jgi:glutathione S-transferase